MPRPRGAWTALLVSALVAVSACDVSSAEPPPIPAGTPVPVAPAAVPAPAHVVVVVFENEDAEAVIGSPDAPYLTSLSRAGANFTDAHGETHPSQPNYLALFSGTTHEVTDDSCPLELHGGNLADQLLTAGRTFVGYSEGLPEAGSTECESDRYRRKHNPWVNFPDLPEAINQPYSALPDDYADLPTVSIVVPDMCNDMHDCGVAAGDSWARENLARYVKWAQSHDSLLVVTFDESEGRDDGNHIPTVLVGPMVAAGASAQPIDHYSILRTLEEMYGLPPLGLAANRSPITGVWTALPG
jgi:phosphatidylinositol-3-phosphatase